MTNLASAATNPVTPALVYIIVSQVKSHRVVYFTDDQEYEPPMDGDWYYIGQYQGDLPAGMTLRNCWRWRFNGSGFVDAQGPATLPPKQKLIEHNRTALLQLLRDKITDVRAPLLTNGTLNAAIRKKKLAQARAFLADPAPDADFALLQGVATARAMSMQAAAELIVDKASKADRVLEETEIVRERLRHAIATATTDERLLELRQELMYDVYPELSQKYKFKVPNTTPIDLDQPLRPSHRAHESARLQALLRERINHVRERLSGGYRDSEALEQCKLRLARQVLDGGPELADFSLVRSAARNPELSLREAAEMVLAQAAARERLLIDTEIDKCRMLARIEVLHTPRDVKELALAIEEMTWNA